jgi:hypothetical protein
VFVFAVQTCIDPSAYDALDVAQWEFYVVPAHLVRECGYRSVSIGWVRQHADSVPFGELASSIETAAQRRTGGSGNPSSGLSSDSH